MAAGLLSFSCSILLFFEHARVQLAVLEPFMEKVFFFLVFLMIPRFLLWSHVSSLRLSSGHSGLVLNLRTNNAAHASLPSSHLLVEDASVWATSQAVEVRCIFLGLCFVLFFSSSWLCSPLRLQNSPQSICGRFPTVWKLLLHDSYPRMGLCP